MARIKHLTKLTIADSWREVKDPATLWGAAPPGARGYATMSTAGS